MVIYKNDIICREISGDLIPIGWTKGVHKKEYIDDYGFKECGMGKYYLSKYKKEDIREAICYELLNRVLLWDFDPSDSNAANLEINNLYLIEKNNIIWNMLDTTEHEDSCVGVSLISNNQFYFVTFCGLGYTMQISNGVECIKKQITK